MVIYHPGPLSQTQASSSSNQSPHDVYRTLFSIGQTSFGKMMFIMRVIPEKIFYPVKINQTGSESPNQAILSCNQTIGNCILYCPAGDALSPVVPGRLGNLAFCCALVVLPCGLPWNL